MIFVTACWESFVEDLLVEAFDHLVAHAAGHAQLSGPAQTAIRKRIMNKSPVDLPVWDGDALGWRALATKWMKDVYIDRWHTPKSANIDNNYKDVLDLADLSASWSWQRMSAVRARKKLDDFIMIRGNIAHRVHHHHAVHKSWPSAYLDHVSRLEMKTDETVRVHLEGLLGATPW